MLTHEAMSRGPVERADKRFRSGDCDVTWGGGPLFHIGSLAPFIGSIGASGTYLTDTFFNPARAVALIETRRGHRDVALVSGDPPDFARPARLYSRDRNGSRDAAVRKIGNAHVR